MKRTTGRKQNDVFVLGDESLIAEPIASREPAPASVMDALEENGPLPFSPPPRLPGSFSGSALGARKLAVLGIGAAAVAMFGVLELSSPGSAHFQGSQTLRRSALVAKPAPIPPVPITHPVRDRPVASKPKPRRHHLAVRWPQRDVHSSKPEREPTQEEAPVSLPVEAASPPPVPVTSPAPVPVPSPPSPPPLPSGGGSEGGESFGFER